MKRFLIGNFAFSLFCFTVSCCMGSTASALAVYNYTGNEYQTAVSPYSTEMALLVSITLHSPLEADLTGYDLLPSILEFSTNDGFQTFTQTTPLAFSEFLVSTDSSGEIVNWAWQFVGSEPGNPGCSRAAAAGTFRHS